MFGCRCCGWSVLLKPVPTLVRTGSRPGMMNGHRLSIRLSAERLTHPHGHFINTPAPAASFWRLLSRYLLHHNSQVPQSQDAVGTRSTASVIKPRDVRQTKAIRVGSRDRPRLPKISIPFHRTPQGRKVGRCGNRPYHARRRADSGRDAFHRVRDQTSGCASDESDPFGKPRPPPASQDQHSIPSHAAGKKSGTMWKPSLPCAKAR